MKRRARKKAVGTVPGDPNRRKVPGTGIVLADSLQLLPEIETGSVDLIVTDPPYCIGLGEATRNNMQRLKLAAGVKLHGDFPAGWAEGYCEHELLPYRWLALELRRVLAEGRHCYIFTTFRPPHGKPGALAQVESWRLAMTAGGFHCQALIWDKVNAGILLGNRAAGYFPQYEMILYCRKRPGSRKLRRGTGPLSDVIAYPRLMPGSGARQGRNGHPTEKPIGLLGWLINRSSEPGELVFDPFVGSGTTCVAASILGRRGLGVEISPGFVEIGRRRLAEEAGQVRIEMAPAEEVPGWAMAREEWEQMAMEEVG